MADIDKGLPNTKLPIPGAGAVTDVNIEEIQKQGPIEVTPEDDGGATIDFDANARPQIPGTEEHFDWTFFFHLLDIDVLKRFR